MLILKATTLAAVDHGFFGRPGGISTGLYAGLNCGPGSGDARADVIENRRRAMAALGGFPLVTLYQVHSADTVIVTEPWELGAAPHADAMATAVPGITLGILTADCAPVLLADSKAGVIGAAHAGWKGAIGGVTDSVIAAMEKLGAERSNIIAAIGPCIAQQSYEVDSSFRERFLLADPSNAVFFIASHRAEHFRFALEDYVAQRLLRAGVAAVDKLAADTYAAEDTFFSFRRATHKGETDYGRNLSAIVLKG
ncbi:MAG: peptidoglycan editing factor PgeF [Rhizomicrobium sp.]|nr:peptidoglycan editing factor PgeF [Rhizomicrobium sp.]